MSSHSPSLSRLSDPVASGSRSSAQSLLESVLSEDSQSNRKGKGKSKEKIPIHLLTNSASDDFSSRVEAKRIQIHNPDRPRPKNDPNDVKEIKRRARDERVKRKLEEASKFKASSFSTASKGKGKGKIDAQELQYLTRSETQNHGRGKRRKKLTYDSTDQERDEGRRAGRKLPLSRREKLSKGLIGHDKSLRSVTSSPLMCSCGRLTGTDSSAHHVPSPQTLHPLHLLWTSYMHQLLGLIDSEGKPSSTVLASNGGLWSISQNHITSMQANICKADLCGSLIRVTRSTNPALVHLSGVVASETANTLVMIPLEAKNFFPSDKMMESSKEKSQSFMHRPRVIPKQNSIFVLSIPLPEQSPSTAKSDAVSTVQYLEFSLHGNQMMQALAARTSRKFKHRRTTEL